MSGELTNGMLGMAERIADIMGYKLVIILDEHEINMEFVDPEEFRNKEAFYDDKHYINGNIFLKGYANPIKPVIDNGLKKADSIDDEDVVRERLHLKPSRNYKTFMRETKFKEMAEVQWNKTNWIKIILYIGIAGTFMLLWFLLIGVI